MLRQTGVLAAGFLFGLGLAVSGMIDPAKVLGFLDITGRWDPSLAFVMGGALAVAGPGLRLVSRRRQPLDGGTFVLPRHGGIDAPILIGAAVFGVGWGLVGFCPGPAVASLVFGLPKALLFVAAMAAGMWLYQVAGRRLARSSPAARESARRP